MTSKRSGARAANTQASSEEESCVKVAIRSRPLNEKERTKRDKLIVQCDHLSQQVSIGDGQVFQFDKVFNSSASQEFVYRSVVADLVEDALKGFNCTVFAYGQTGTGKTFTMEGHRTEYKGDSPFWYGELAGMIPRAAQHIFQRMDACEHNYTIRVSYLELYNEDVFDLLQPGTSKPLSIFEGGGKGITVSGMQHITVKSPEEIFKILEQCAHKKRVAETEMNKRSSRSHCIFTISIKVIEIADNGEEMVRIGKLNLVDLAGSENTKQSGVVGTCLKQATMINQSLLSLRRVITALGSGKSSNHIPFRDSKLTRLLQESLGGRAKTCMIATISPALDCLEETKSTLTYALNAKNIKNTPVANQQLSKKALINSFHEEIESLKNQLAASKAGEGHFVDHQTWELHLANVDKMHDLNTALDNQQQHLDQLTQNLEARVAQLEASYEIDSELESDLKQTLDDVQHVQAQFKEAEETIYDYEAAIHLQQQTEKALHAQCDEFMNQSKKNLEQIKILHQSKERHAQVQLNNLTVTDAMAEDVQQQLLSIQTNLTHFHQEALEKYVNKFHSCWKNLQSRTKSNLETISQETASIHSQLTAQYQQIQTNIIQQTDKTNIFIRTLYRDNLHDFTSSTANDMLQFFAFLQRNTSTLQAQGDDHMSLSNKEIVQIRDKISDHFETLSNQTIDHQQSLLASRRTRVVQFQENQHDLTERQNQSLASLQKQMKKSISKSHEQMLERISSLLKADGKKQQSMMEQSLSGVIDSLASSHNVTSQYCNREAQSVQQLSENLTQQKTMSTNRLQNATDDYEKLQDMLQKSHQSTNELTQTLMENIDSVEEQDQTSLEEFAETAERYTSNHSEAVLPVYQNATDLITKQEVHLHDTVREQFEYPISQSAMFIDNHPIAQTLADMDAFYQRLFQQQSQQIAQLQLEIKQQKDKQVQYQSNSQQGTPKKQKQYLYQGALPNSRCNEQILKHLIKKRKSEATAVSKDKENVAPIQKSDNTTSENVLKPITATPEAAEKPKKVIAQKEVKSRAANAVNGDAAASTTSNALKRKQPASSKPTSRLPVPPTKRRKVGQ